MSIHQNAKVHPRSEMLEKSVTAIEVIFRAKNNFPTHVPIPKFLYNLMGSIHSIGASIDHEKEKMRMLLASINKK
tara:strand:+ start:188 stop:412 length:225 start_codon:yes stop_codon:yes gene_type:complete